MKFRYSCKVIERYIGARSPLLQPITTEELSQALSQMTNNKAAYDDITAELLKYASPEIHTEISEALNEMFAEHADIEIGAGKIAAIEKPKKPMPGPVKDLRPITLLKVIRKILSKITLIRLKPYMDRYLSPSQSAYRNGRSTTDIVWAYRWMLAKAQSCDVEIHSIGIDMTAAFDTVDRSKMLSLIEEIAGPDEARMVRALLSNTTLEVKLPGYDKNKIVFESNLGTPQGDNLSGPLLILFFEMALRSLRKKLEAIPMEPDHDYANSTIVTKGQFNPLHNDHSYSTQVSPRVPQIKTPLQDHQDYQRNASNYLPEEATYADDADYLTLSKEKKRLYLKHVTSTLKEDDLYVNESKTEVLVMKRGDKETETWRQSTKLGSVLGDVEDISRRKQLAVAAFQTKEKIWIEKHSVPRELKVDLVESLVMSILLYNSCCWGLRKCDIEGIEVLQRHMLRRVCNIKYPEIISNRNLYKVTKTKPASIRIAKGRWQYFGHALRLHLMSPPQQAMDFFFAFKPDKKFPGRRATIVSTLQDDIKMTKIKFPQFEIDSLSSHSDLRRLRALASDRKKWRRITKSITDTTEANSWAAQPDANPV